MPSPAVLPDASPPELFTPLQLDAHAARIAASHGIASNPRRARPLLPRLDESAAQLDEAYLFLSAAARKDPQPVGSEEWLRDNHHVVQDQVRDIREHLPRKYYLELPKLADGPLQGYPRVFLFARELIAHTAGRVDLETLIEFTAAYQRVAPLSIGETWAIPIMLRLALVEELSRLAASVVDARRSREAARRISELSVVRWDDRTVARTLQGGREPDGRLSSAFVVELLQWLRDQPAAAAPMWHALHRALEAQDDSAEEVLRAEHQREAAGQLAIGNVITSMRFASAIDWPLFFERASVVEQILREDPSGSYASMDFQTRDRYRHAVEQLSRRTGKAETDVARAAIALAVTATRDEPHSDRSHHVGYYLISRGRFRLESQVGYRPPVRERIVRFIFAHPALGYLGTIGALWALSVCSFVAYALRHGGSNTEAVVVALVVLLPVSELVVSVVHLIVTWQVPPRPLPKLALRDGIPEHLRTMVVVPAIADSIVRVDALFDDLEVRFLGNRDEHLHFALLTDFADADSEALPGDAAILAHATTRVDGLNERYGAGRFFFLHRARRWNAAEGRWMGWERKRGKLEEFNHLLRGAEGTTFMAMPADLAILRRIRYVITLDSDTQLPLDAARRMVGTLAHPLNTPRFDAQKGRVTQGYGVLQPRVMVDLVSANRSQFARIFSGHVGLDPYTTAVSDVYQDLFHEGSYVGKGIYDVDAFNASLAGRVPENALLSHDLFEGSFARAALCTDIHLVDDYPSHYLAFAARQHRWARGDWQIARWTWRTVRDASGRKVRNTLPAISRWKIFDNLRRSLLAPSLMVLFAAGWTVLPGNPGLWTSLGVLVLAFPALSQAGRSFFTRVRGVPLRMHLATEREGLTTSTNQSLLWTALLAHQSWVMADAVVRTLWRMLFTRRHLLEWVSADRLAKVKRTAPGVLLSMWAAPALAALVFALVAAIAPWRLLLALPFVALWFAAPALAWATGRPAPDSRQPISDDDRAALRMVARRTWLFFEDLLTPTDHWLIPDNYQEDRDELVAHRTSPTNIGLQLLSTLAAYDFGYISASGVVERLEPAFATLLKLPRYHGHFYNWYDTRTLAPLLPTYVSTVDSGNLAGYLLTVKSGLLQLAQEPVIRADALDGMHDALRLCGESLLQAPKRMASRAGRALTRELATLHSTLAERPTSLEAWPTLLNTIEDQIASIGQLLHELEDAAGQDEMPAIPAAAQWLERIAVAVAQRRADLARSPADTAELMDRAARLADLADDLVEEMDFGFLFDRQRGLFSIGFNVTAGRLDSSFYDALASEARLASFVAIALGQVSTDHWFKLGRSLTPAGGARALLSWSASMFEYFMPLLVMRVYPDTLLDETYQAVVDRQMRYAASRRVPWGISESAYNAQDLDRNYQYRAFGVPGLGLKRGLGEDLVVAPYASLLAAPLVAADVTSNLVRLARLGMAGRYGFYEAIDFTPSRLPEDGSEGVVLPTFMAHHQGMNLVSIDNALHDFPMQRRFHVDPRVQAADLLLQER
ncbi:MAG TPA: glucoamylase family protein, partial [Steroidobacteraceae bacterium]